MTTGTRADSRPRWVKAREVGHRRLLGDEPVLALPVSGQQWCKRAKTRHLALEFSKLAAPQMKEQPDVSGQFAEEFARKYGPLGLPTRLARTKNGLEQVEFLSDWIDEADRVYIALRGLRVCSEKPATLPRSGDWWIRGVLSLADPGDDLQVARAVEERINDGLSRAGTTIGVRFAAGTRYVWAIRETTNIQAIWREVGERAAGVMCFDVCQACGSVMLKSGERGGTSRRTDAVTCSAKCKMRLWRQRRGTVQE